ncbi:hypothetical protein CC78DRAFT_456856 [Lojkania enalia]|uniref:Uncharacterized protein n=1 Tax=Lojkania enalia TaxID=147567 RepID=A0A9P4N5X1_9PLEO|nr:hypothetical protein CC78DRAFT_456856 [Didymosphaeria enalia]
MYKEPVTNVANLISNLRQMVNLGSARFRIYIKDVDANPADIRLRTGAEIIEKLPNVGREGETYLYHILNNYESLARHTVFLQADVHNPREFYPRIRDYFDPTRTGMLSLGFSGNACDCQNCSDRFNWTDTSHTFPSIHGRIYNSTPCTDILLSYKGQFVVSAKRIRGINKEIYHDLREAFFNQSNRAHKQEFWQGEEDSMSNPVFGHTIERIWNLLFQCGGMDVTWKCPTLLSGWRIGGTIADCQCFDE